MELLKDIVELLLTPVSDTQLILLLVVTFAIIVA